MDKIGAFFNRKFYFCDRTKGNFANQDCIVMRISKSIFTSQVNRSLLNRRFMAALATNENPRPEPTNGSTTIDC